MCCYISEDFATVVSQNVVSMSQEKCQIMIHFLASSLSPCPVTVGAVFT
jgi:hypothetical protein